MRSHKKTRKNRICGDISASFGFKFLSTKKPLFSQNYTVSGDGLEVEVKSIDEQGRIILPKVWREKYLKNKKAIISAKGDTIEIKPFAAVDLTEYFDKMSVDLKAALSDWHTVRTSMLTCLFMPFLKLKDNCNQTR